MVASARSAGPAFGIEDTLPMALYSPIKALDQATYLSIYAQSRTILPVYMRYIASVPTAMVI
jgi:hypothetical protein